MPTSLVSVCSCLSLLYRQFYIPDHQFERILGMTKEQYMAMPKWRQNYLKKKAKLS